MRFRPSRSPREGRSGRRLVRLLATTFGALLVAAIAVPQAQAVPPNDFYAGLLNQVTGRCADLPNYGSVPVNTPVTQYDCNLSSNDNQVWHFQPTGTFQGLTYYKIQNVKSGLCLDLPNYGSNPAGTHVSVYTCAPNQAADNQQWYFEYAGTDQYGNEVDQLVNAASNLCLDVANWASDGSDLANGLPLTIYNCYNSAWANGGYDDHLWEVPTV